MEGESGDQSRKRRRDDDHDDDEKKEFVLSSRKGKKPETMTNIMSSSREDNDDGGSRFCYDDDIGVFDFPWLKEGVVYKADECLEKEDVFGACSYLDHVQDDRSFLADFDAHDSLEPPPLDRDFHDNYHGKFDGVGGGDDLGLFDVEELEPLDCIWSSVLDEPLDSTCLNKA